MGTKDKEQEIVSALITGYSDLSDNIPKRLVLSALISMIVHIIHQEQTLVIRRGLTDLVVKTLTDSLIELEKTNDNDINTRSDLK